MRCPVLIAAAWLLACTPDQTTSPPERRPDLRGQTGQSPAPLPSPLPSPPPTTPMLAEQPAATTVSGVAGHDDPLEAIAPRTGRAGLPGPRGTRGGCEGGSRTAGESWKVDCNACSCGDDGQVTCTAMACGYR